MKSQATVVGALLAALAAFAHPASPQSKHLAPGFSALTLGSKVAIMPTDIELFSISAGGVLERRRTGPKPLHGISRTPSFSGVGFGTVAKGELYAMLYAAPQLGFFARHQRSVEQMARSAKLKL